MSTFKNIHTNEIVRVMSEDDNFYILDSGQKIDKKLFVQSYVSNESSPTPIVESNQNTNQQTQPIHNQGNEVNVDDFFAAKPVISGADNLQKLDTSKIIDLPQRGQGWIPDNVKDLNTQNPSSSALQQPQSGSLSIEQQKQILIDNYNAQHQGQPGQQIIGSKTIDVNDDAAIDQMMNQVSPPKPTRQLNENGLTEAQEIMRQQQIELSGTDPYKDKIMQYRAKQGFNPTPVAEPKIIQQPTQANIQQPIVNEDDEVIKIFRRFKRIQPINIKFGLKDKIGKPELIEMMADGLDGDIIQFYTDEIFKKFISEIDDIKENIYKQIYKKVYGVDKPIEIIEEKKSTMGLELVEVKTNEELGIPSGTEIILIPGGKTKGGKQKYKFIDNKGKLVELLMESAQKKQYKPATKKDIKKHGK